MNEYILEWFKKQHLHLNFLYSLQSVPQEHMAMAAGKYVTAWTTQLVTTSQELVIAALAGKEQDVTKVECLYNAKITELLNVHKGTTNISRQKETDLDLYSKPIKRLCFLLAGCFCLLPPLQSVWCTVMVHQSPFCCWENGQGCPQTRSFWLRDQSASWGKSRMRKWPTAQS